MTDNEIIKALECCRDFGDCSLCPYEKATFENEADCAERMHTDALALINRQKAEIERLQNDYLSMQSTLAKMSMGVEQAKSEAIKEFAERLKANYSVLYAYKGGLIKSEIDNLVKEMTEDQK